MKFTRILWLWATFLLITAGHAQTAPDSIRIESVDIHIVPLGKSFRTETYLSCVKQDDSRFMKRVQYHLEVRSLDGLSSIDQLKREFLNAEHLAAEQDDNDIIYGIIDLLTPSGYKARLYMTGEMRYFFEDKVYENEALSAVLFQYLTSDARPQRNDR